MTQVHDMAGWSSLATYQRAYARGELPLRVYSVVPIATWARLRDYVAEHGRGDDRLWWGGLKGFVDGSLGSTTAWFYEPYDDEPGTSRAHGHRFGRAAHGSTAPTRPGSR